MRNTKRTAPKYIAVNVTRKPHVGVSKDFRVVVEGPRAVYFVDVLVNVETLTKNPALPYDCAAKDFVWSRAKGDAIMAVAEKAIIASRLPKASAQLALGGVK